MFKIVYVNLVNVFVSDGSDYENTDFLKEGNESVVEFSHNSFLLNIIIYMYYTIRTVLYATLA